MMWIQADYTLNEKTEHILQPLSGPTWGGMHDTQNTDAGFSICFKTWRWGCELFVLWCQSIVHWSSSRQSSGKLVKLLAQGRFSNNLQGGG